MTTRPIRLTISLALSTALLAGVAGASLAGQAEQEQAAADDEPAAVSVERVKGKRLKVAKAKIAKNWTRFNDPVGDQVTRDGSPALGAEPWTDLVEVNVVSADAAVKMLRILAEDFPPGTARSYYGAEADWRAGQDAFFIIAKTEQRLPRDAEGSVQLIVTFDGDAAVPLQPNDPLGLYAGAEQFSISGLFDGGTWDSGTTTLDGWQRTDVMPFYNGLSRDMGYYDRKPGAFVHIARLPRDATAATITLRANGPGGEYFDSVELPSGGRFIGTGDPAWGLKLAKGAMPLVCRSVETLSAGSAGAEDVEPGSALIRYTVGWEDGSDVADQVVALGDGVDVALTGPAMPEEALIVEAAVSVAPAGDAATFTVVVPEGQWLVSPVSADDLVTSNGQSLIDLRPLTGSAGVLTGAGLDGFVAGVEHCGE